MGSSASTVVALPFGYKNWEPAQVGVFLTGRAQIFVDAFQFEITDEFVIFSLLGKLSPSGKPRTDTEVARFSRSEFQGYVLTRRFHDA
jgi:hypothetical protein